jgi:hypothetical protein
MKNRCVNRSVMKILSVSARKLLFGALLAGYCLAAAPSVARAGLGGDASSIESDAAATSGKSQAVKQEPQPSASYDVKTFVTGNGATVREYVAHSGPVFGVAWQGRRPPDLSVLLGSYYPEYATASASQRHANLHHSVIAGPNSIVVMGGHMGHLVGRAYVPALAPAGVDPKAVVK